MLADVSEVLLKLGLKPISFSLSPETFSSPPPSLDFKKSPNLQIHSQTIADRWKLRQHVSNLEVRIPPEIKRLFNEAQMRTNSWRNTDEGMSASRKRNTHPSKLCPGTSTQRKSLYSSVAKWKCLTPECPEELRYCVLVVMLLVFFFC